MTPIETSLSAELRTYIDESAPVMALRLDARQYVTNANEHARRVLGADLQGRCLRDLVVGFTPVPDLSGPEATRAAGHLLSLNTPARLPESYRFRFFSRPDGWLALGSIDFDEQMRLRTEVLALNRELNDLARQLHLANAELRELNQLKNRFLGMAAHDLRRPISLIMTYSEFVLDEAGAQLFDEHRKFLSSCLVAATGMKRMIDNFLDVSIIESGALQLELAPASVAAIVAGAEPIARLQAEKKHVTLLLEVEDPGWPLRVDAGKIQQVLLNLVGNAVEHSVAGQRVWLSSHWQAQELEFTVRDEGPGIAPGDLARLFMSFARAGTQKTAGERSVGLGLAIARLVVEAHGGRIWVECAPAQGASFKFTLPVNAEAHNRT